jgi:hypothetical protein
MASRSFRTKNPGNIKAHYGKGKTSSWVTSRSGYLGYDAQGFAIFEFSCLGTSAMVQLLSGSKYRDLTIGQALHQYAPKNENDTEAYIHYVCDHAGISSLKVIKELDPFEFLKMVGFMIKFEGWEP